MYLSINGDGWYSSIIMLTSDKITGPYRYQAPVVMSGFRSGDSYKDTDLEIVLGQQTSLPDRYAPSDNYGNHWPNCIDPCVFYDENGKLWMSYGSWSGGIFMLELDENSGLRNYDVNYEISSTSDPYFGKKIAGGHYVSGEASYIEYIGGYYFLFMTYGGLEAAGGYQMRVFRSQNPDGPYVDSKGSSAIFNSYLLNFGPTANDGNRGVNIFGAYNEWGYQVTGDFGERAQGHNSIIAAEDGRTYLVYHTRFQNREEGHEVRVHQVYQNEEGWLVAAPFEYTGEGVKSAGIAAAQKVATANIPGSYKFLQHNYKLDHAAKAFASPVDIKLNADGTITGDRTGTWSAKTGTSYITINIGGEYKGVIIEQTLEPKNEKAPCFTALNSKTGVTIWGYKYAE
jgi:arabinan endo-1,5-alpha-L-arabinosidase